MWTNAPILVEVVLVLGGALAWGFWELHTLGKARKERERQAASNAASDQDDRPPE